jgi:hypothetical protein
VHEDSAYTKEDGTYALTPQVLNIRHIYLSTLQQQYQSAKEILEKAGVQNFQDITANKPQGTRDTHVE